MNPSIHIITHFVSPYQVELFNAVAASSTADLFVSYLHDKWTGRYWKNIPIRHEHCVLNDSSAQEKTRLRVADSDVVVFNLYRDRFVRRMIKLRAGRLDPWAFWGERPSFRLKGRLGTLYRRWQLAPLLHSQAPIWGIGSWATAKYRREFGPHRRYAELPYYSDLERFRRSTTAAAQQPAPRRFLYSGALAARKGVDLLARGFRDIVAEGHDVHLTLLGTGDLDAQLREELQGLEDRVRFVGFQDWQQLPSWYHQADILVAPSRYDGWGLIVPEGLAAGLPVIATDRMGAAIDLIEPGKNGWICRAGDFASLARALRQAATLPDHQLEVHRRLAESSVAEHQLVNGAEKLVHLCEQALGNWSA